MLEIPPKNLRMGAKVSIVAFRKLNFFVYHIVIFIMYIIHGLEGCFDDKYTLYRYNITNKPLILCKISQISNRFKTVNLLPQIDEYN